MKKIFTFRLFVDTYHPKTALRTTNPDINQSGKLHRAPDQCVENIMNFARAYRVTESKSAGRVELMMN